MLCKRRRIPLAWSASSVLAAAEKYVITELNARQAPASDSLLSMQASLLFRETVSRLQLQGNYRAILFPFIIWRVWKECRGKGLEKRRNQMHLLHVNSGWGNGYNNWKCCSRRETYTSEKEQIETLENESRLSRGVKLKIRLQDFRQGHIKIFVEDAKEMQQDCVTESRRRGAWSAAAAREQEQIWLCISDMILYMILYIAYDIVHYIILHFVSYTMYAYMTSYTICTLISYTM